MYDVNKLMYDIRGTAFTFEKRTIFLNDSTFGLKKFTDARLLFLINQAGIIVQTQLQEDRQVAHNHLLTFRDTIALPDDLMFLQSLRLYEDYIENEAEGTADAGGSSTTLIDADAGFDSSMIGYRIDNTTDGSSSIITAVNSTTELECSAGLSAGTDNTFSEDDEYEIYNHLQSTSKTLTEAVELEFVASDEKMIVDRPVGTTSGTPTKYSFYEARGTNSPRGARFAVFNYMPDQKYFFDVYYFPVHPTLTTSSDQPYIATQYQELIYLKLAELVALRLGDMNRKAEFKNDFTLALPKYKILLDDQYTPISPVINAYGIIL